MTQKEKNMPVLTDQEFYDKAYAYFEYHAGQRMTMINFFIVVFGACIALYGDMLNDHPFSGVLISLFLLIVTILFYCIDLRNRFDVKQSQNVLCQIEKANGADVLRPGHTHLYGVFSNEGHSYPFYDRKTQKHDKRYRALKNRSKSADSAQTNKLDEDITNFLGEESASVSVCEVRHSFAEPPLFRLSSCIKFLYFSCMIVSVLAFLYAIYVFSLHLYI